MRYAMLTLVLASTALGQETAPAEIEMAKPVELTHAGIRLAVPADFKLQPLGESRSLLRAEKVEGDEVVMAVTLRAMAVAEDATLRSFIESVNPRRDLTVRRFRMVKSLDMKIADVEGQVQVQTYQLRGVETTALRAYFLRPAPAWQTQLAYDLAVEADTAHGQQARRTMSAILKTVESAELVRPIHQKIQEWDEPVESRRFGYSIETPKWWKVAALPTREMAIISQMDYSLSGEMAPRVEFHVRNVGVLTAEQITKSDLATLEDRIRRSQQRYTVVRNGPARMADHDGWDFLIHQMIPPRPTHPELPTLNVMLGYRAVCLNGYGYFLGIYAVTDKPEDVDAVLDEIAKRIKLSAPEEKPGSTTAPASGPADAAPSATTQPAEGE